MRRGMAGVEAPPPGVYHETGTSACLRQSWRSSRRDNAVGCLAEELCRLDRPFETTNPTLSRRCGSSETPL